uniref:Transmembrane protein n=1 Tax=Fagus sylvatica TaxID=28930 RepID=A0A2N9EHC1_FAGSY
MGVCFGVGVSGMGVVIGFGRKFWWCRGGLVVVGMGVVDLCCWFGGGLSCRFDLCCGGLVVAGVGVVEATVVVVVLWRLGAGAVGFW